MAEINYPERTYIVPVEKQWEGPYLRLNEISSKDGNLFKEGDRITMSDFKNHSVSKFRAGTWIESEDGSNTGWRGWYGEKEIVRVDIDVDSDPNSEKFGLKVQTIFVKNITE